MKFRVTSYSKCLREHAYELQRILKQATRSVPSAANEAKPYVLNSNLAHDNTSQSVPKNCAFSGALAAWIFGAAYDSENYDIIFEASFFYYSIVPLKKIEYGVYGGLIMTYRKPRSIYLRGTIRHTVIPENTEVFRSSGPQCRASEQGHVVAAPPMGSK